MDNPSAHKGGRVKELIEQRGGELSSTRRPTRRSLNPIEEAFGKIKSLLRKA
jgi:transposase